MPLSLAIALIICTGGLCWWLGYHVHGRSWDARFEEHERELTFEFEQRRDRSV